MTMGTAMPRLLAATGGLGLMAKGCSEEEGLQFASNIASEVQELAFRALIGKGRYNHGSRSALH